MNNDWTREKRKTRRFWNSEEWGKETRAKKDYLLAYLTIDEKKRIAVQLIYHNDLGSIVDEDMWTLRKILNSAYEESVQND